MNFQSNGSHSISVSQGKRKIVMDGTEYDMPKGMTGSSVTTINNKSFIDGFELVNGEWKRTLRALWHLFF